MVATARIALMVKKIEIVRLQFRRRFIKDDVTVLKSDDPVGIGKSQIDVVHG